MCVGWGGHFRRSGSAVSCREKGQGVSGGDGAAVRSDYLMAVGKTALSGERPVRTSGGGTSRRR